MHPINTLVSTEHGLGTIVGYELIKGNKLVEAFEQVTLDSSLELSRYIIQLGDDHTWPHLDQLYYASHRLITLIDFSELILTLNPMSGLIEDSHYWYYLNKLKPVDIHAIKTKAGYLKSIGFTKGSDTLDSKALHCLKCIEQVYFDRIIKPTLVKKV
jgi:hypothetical protein